MAISTATHALTATIPAGAGPVRLVMTATISVGNGPLALGSFIQSAPEFVGTPGHSNCHGQSVAALNSSFGNLDAAAALLGYSSVKSLQAAILDCGGAVGVKPAGAHLSCVRGWKQHLRRIGRGYIVRGRHFEAKTAARRPRG